MKSHLKRLFMPKTWHLLRKRHKFITRPKPGMHPLKDALSINTLLKEVLGYAKTTKEVLNILNKSEVLVDKKRRKEKKFMVGLMDVVELPKIKEAFRIIFNKKGKIVAIPAPEKESNLKLCKITGKGLLRKKIQINLHDGRNILTEKNELKRGDSLLIELPAQKIVQHLKLEPGCMVYFISGKKIGQIAKLKEIKGKSIICTSKESEFETLKDYAFVIGKEKPVVSIE